MNLEEQNLLPEPDQTDIDEAVETAVEVTETNEVEEPRSTGGAESNMTLSEAQELIAQLREGNRVLRDKYIRSHADLENFKRRMERDAALKNDETKMMVLRQCLDILDNFDRALEAIDDPSSPFAVGVRMIHKQFTDFLSTNRVEEIPSAGKMFDPYLHEALAKETVSDVPENTITAVFQKGYLYKDKLLRAAQVKVAVAPEPPSEGSPETDVMLTDS